MSHSKVKKNDSHKWLEERVRIFWKVLESNRFGVEVNHFHVILTPTCLVDNLGLNNETCSESLYQACQAKKTRSFNRLVKNDWNSRMVSKGLVIIQLLISGLAAERMGWMGLRERETIKIDQETIDWQQFGTLIWGDDSMMIPSIDSDPQQKSYIFRTFA